MSFTRTGIVALSLACLAAPAFAAAQGAYDTEPTREQFVAQADALCKDAYPKVRPLIREFSKAGHDGKAVKAGRALIRVAKLLDGLVGEIEELSRPPRDATRIGDWLATAHEANRTAIRAGRAFVKRKIARGNEIYRKAGKLSESEQQQSKFLDFEVC